MGNATVWVAFLAWEGDAYDPTFHSRSDLDVLSLEIEQEEGALATVRMEVARPAVSLAGVLTTYDVETQDLVTSPAPRRVHVSWSPDGTPGRAEPLATGALVAIPTEIGGDTLTVEVICAPPDLDSRVEVAAAPLRVAPWYVDAAFGPDARGDPTSVLEARAALWDVDPVTHAVTATDVLPAAVPTLDLAGAHVAEDARLSLATRPVGRVVLECEARWTRTSVGRVDVWSVLQQAWDAGGGTVRTSTDVSRLVEPRGAEGWSLVRSDVHGYDVPFGGGETVIGSAEQRSVETGEVAGYLNTYARLHAPRWDVSDVVLEWSLSEERVERLRIEFDCGLGGLLGEEEVETDRLVLGDLQVDRTTPLHDGTVDYAEGDVVFASGRAWRATRDVPAGPFSPWTGRGAETQWEGTASAAALDDPSADRVFDGPAGEGLVGHLLLRARARAVDRARCLRMEVRATLDDAGGATCRDTVRLAHPRVPGGTLVGKVAGYRKRWDAGTGVADVRLTLAAVATDGRARPAPDDGGRTVHDVDYTVAGDDPVDTVDPTRLPDPGYAVTAAWGYDGWTSVSVPASSGQGVADVQVHVLDGGYDLRPMRSDVPLERSLACTARWAPAPGTAVDLSEV